MSMHMVETAEKNNERREGMTTHRQDVVCKRHLLVGENLPPLYRRVGNFFATTAVKAGDCCLTVKYKTKDGLVFIVSFLVEKAGILIKILYSLSCGGGHPPQEEIDLFFAQLLELCESIV